MPYKPATCGGCVFLAMLLVVVSSCTTTKGIRPILPPPPPEVQATVIDYVASDAFDLLLETALTNQDPAIIIRTGRKQPDWDGPLNAWLAAWNMGGKLDREKNGRKVRAQVPLPSVRVDGDSIREFRILVDGLMNRVETLARNGAVWWAEEKLRKHRIDLLRPYNLRFHLDEEKNIQIVFFNGRYAESYPQFMKSLTKTNGDESPEWTREWGCSACLPSGPIGATVKAGSQPTPEVQGP